MNGITCFAALQASCTVKKVHNGLTKSLLARENETIHSVGWFHKFYIYHQFLNALFNLIVQVLEFKYCIKHFKCITLAFLKKKKIIKTNHIFNHFIL